MPEAFSMTMTHQGRRQCGDVRYVVSGGLRDVIDCHCERCRRFTGHHMAATGAATGDVAIDDPGRSLRWHSPDPSVEYGFCGRCGSSMFWRATDRTNWLSIAAGSLDQPCGLATTYAWWVDEAGDYYERAAGLVEYATEPERSTSP